MKYILKSARGFIKESDFIRMSPGSFEREKIIRSDEIKDIWEEMEFLSQNKTYENKRIFNMLEDNHLVFSIDDNDWPEYKEFSRNIQFLSLNSSSNPFHEFKHLRKQNILVIGLGTIGSPLIEELDKFGFSNITIVDGDKIELKNLTAQLSYSKQDIGKYKAKVLSEMKASVVKHYCTYLTADNIDDIFQEVKPSVVFCCADDPTGKLFQHLISKISNSSVQLFISGYSQDEILVNHITNENSTIFKNYYQNQHFNSKSDILSANSGTIIKGTITSALILNLFLTNFQEKIPDIHFFNLRKLTSYNQNLWPLNLNEFEQRFVFRNIEKESLKLGMYLENNTKIENNNEFFQLLFEFQYYTFLKHSIDIHDPFYKYLSTYLNSLMLKYRGIKENNVLKADISKLESLKNHYYVNNDVPLSNYCKNIDNHSNLDIILNSYRNFILYTDFRELYETLVNNRKRGLIDPHIKLIESYGYDFIRHIYKKLKPIVVGKKYTEYDFLAIEFLNNSKITIDDAFNIMNESIDSKSFSNFICDFTNNGFLDYTPRQNKTINNFTLFNPFSTTSKTVMTYTDNFNGVTTLTHELMQAYMYDIFKHRLTSEYQYETSKIFWKTISKLGEMFIFDYCSEMSSFFHKSFYHLSFSFLDYELMRMNREISIEDILNKKRKLLNHLGINPRLLKFTEYNFIDYRMLYSEDMLAYDEVFSDIIALSIYESTQTEGLNFDMLISKISTLSNLSIDSLLSIFNLNQETIVDLYVKRLDSFLKHQFLEVLEYGLTSK